MLEIKVLGPGCANCKRLEQLTRKAVEQLGIQAAIAKVTDYDEILSYGVISTPGLVINEKTISEGRVPSFAEVTSYVASAIDSN